MSTTTMPGTRQRDDALHNAEITRLRRARLRAEIKGQTNQEARGLVAAAIEEMPDWLETVDVTKLVMFAPRVGVNHVDQLLESAGIYSSRRLMDLSARQRRVLADELRRIGGRG